MQFEAYSDVSEKQHLLNFSCYYLQDDEQT